MYRPPCARVKTYFGFNHSHSHKHLMPIRCKRWTCPYCARVNTKALAARIVRGKPTKMITLTAKHTPEDDPEVVYKHHRQSIRRLTQWIRRNYGEFESVTICELHADGFPHWHLLVRSPYIPQARLSWKWEQLTGSKIVDIRMIHRPEEAIHYVTKYILKSTGIHKPSWLTRVCQFSKHFSPRKQWFPPNGWEYELRPLDPADYEESLRRAGFNSVETKNGLLFWHPNDPLTPDILAQFDPPSVPAPP